MDNQPQEGQDGSEHAELENTDPPWEDIIEVEYESEKKCGQCSFRSATHYQLESETDDLSICGSCLSQRVIEYLLDPSP
jgi:hypothetical protein